MTSEKRCWVQPVEWVTVETDLPTSSSLDPATLPDIDLFIVAKGFEERVLAIPRALVGASKRPSVGRVLVGEYITNAEDNARRFAELKPLLDGLSTEPRTEFNADNPQETLTAIDAVLTAVRPGARPVVALDISGASSTLIFSALAALFRNPLSPRVLLLYSEAVHYFPDVPGAERGQENPASTLDYVRETGVRGVETCELHKGCHHENQAHFVIAVPGLARERMQRCLHHLGEDIVGAAGDYVFWVLPVSSTAAFDNRLERIRAVAQELSSASIQEDQFISCAAIDYRDACRQLIRISDLHAGSNLSLVHMGSKMQAVGFALGLEARTEIALVYARPQTFAAARYSQGAGPMHQVIFSDPRATIAALRRIGCLTVQTEVPRPTVWAT